jgi:hypothetical protein
MSLLEILIVILVLFWLLGWAFFPLGGIIHLVLVIIVILIVFRFLEGRGV